MNDRLSRLKSRPRAILSMPVRLQPRHPTKVERRIVPRIPIDVNDGVVLAHAGTLFSQERLSDQLPDEVASPAVSRHQHHPVEPTPPGFSIHDAGFFVVHRVHATASVHEILVARELRQCRSTQGTRADRLYQVTVA